MSDAITIRRAGLADADLLTQICFDAFGGINARHGFPPDFPVPDAAAGMMRLVLALPHVYGVVAEADGKCAGSAFLWEGGSVAGIGPVTVDPAVQARSVGRRMMEALLDRARDQRFAGVRLVQAAFNTRSMSLYTKLGFDVREPLACLQGGPMNQSIHGHTVRPMTANDVAACDAVCLAVHGHARTGELTAAVAQGQGSVVEQGGQVVGYATDVGFFGHAVALTDDGLMALIAAAPRITGPGLLLPSRNARVLRWCLAGGLQIVQPMTLMTIGLYNEPRGAFVPSILF